MVNTFSEFSNIYSLSKTLRFELKPVGNTQKMLEGDHVFEKDELIHEKYKKTKPYFDKLHREFVEESLSNADLSGLKDYFEALKDWQKDKKNTSTKKAYEQKAQDLRKEVVLFFEGEATAWANKKYANIGFKNKDTEILFEEAIFDVLKERYGSEPESFIEIEEKDKKGHIILDEDGKPKIKTISIFDSWKGFKGYFIKFFETRRNFYQDGGTTTAIATRIVDHNCKRFCDNLLLFESLKGKVDFDEVEKTYGISLSQVFSLEFYNQCLLQNGIDRYNVILGGEVLKNGEKNRGINECINKYRQDNKGEKLGFFKALDKQILSEKEAVIEGIQDENALLEVLKRFKETAEKKTWMLKTLFEDFMLRSKEHDLSQVYLSKEALNTITHKWTSETEFFAQLLYETMKKEKLVKYEKKDNSYKFPDFIALSYIKEALESSIFEGHFWQDRYYEITDFEGKNQWDQFLAIFSFEFNSLFERKIQSSEGCEKIVGYNSSLKNLEILLKKEPFTLSVDSKISIKEFADSILTIYQIAKYFALEKKRGWLTDYDTGEFYENPDFGYRKFYENAYEDIVQVYNDLRNFLTKKPYSEEKWKLNFNHSKLLQGFTESRTEKSNNGTQYGGYILRKREDNDEYSYFLGVSKNPQLISYFEEKDNSRDSEYERLNYYQIKTNSIYGASYEGDLQNDKLNLSEKEVIQKIKDALSGYGERVSEISNIIERKYETIREIQKDIDRVVKDKGRSFIYKRISQNQLDLAYNCKQGFYLFKIYSKDFSAKKQRGSRENLHTMYFKTLMHGDQSTIDVGNAEIFYRPKTKVFEKEDIVTQKNKNKIEKENLNLYRKKRYAENKTHFHLSIILNCGEISIPNKENAKKAFSYKFNNQINQFLANNADINIIGVDRGEKHLAYYSVINQKGEILTDKEGDPISGSLNSLGKDGSGESVNYHQKLTEKAGGREQARKDWQAVERIKDLKKGYISQVVRKLADLSIEYNAIIVFEDLNMRFKQIRGGIEKSIYQQLEKALIEKLNFLVNKGEKDPNAAGHLLRAYQLAAPFTTFKDMGKQTGIIFYTQAAYTSKIDPVTGWRPHLYLKYSSAEKAKEDILKFSKIEFKSGRFEFTYDIKNFQQAKESPKNTVWKVCSSVERFRWDKSLNQNKGGYKFYPNLTDHLKELFEKYGIDLSSDIKGQMHLLNTKGNEKFFEHLIFFFNLICQIRNTDDSDKAKRGGKDDFILSPVEPFFDSRTPKKFGNNLPENGDDNGAYNIARKGIIILKKISDFAQEKGGCEKIMWSDLYVSNTEWDNFIYNK